MPEPADFGAAQSHSDPNFTDLYGNIETFIDNMLTLAEDMLVECIRHKTKFKIIDFAQIPESERNPDCPMRITATMKPTAAGQSPNG